jgi:hypothetical protein
MVVLSKIYTRTGDSGETSLGNGDRVRKDDLRVASYGTIDETTATLGMARLHGGADGALIDHVHVLSPRRPASLPLLQSLDDCPKRPERARSLPPCPAKAARTMHNCNKFIRDLSYRPKNQYG